MIVTGMTFGMAVELLRKRKFVKRPNGELLCVSPMTNDIIYYSGKEGV